MKRPLLLDHEVARFAIVSANAPVLMTVGWRALRFLEHNAQGIRASAWAKTIVSIVEDAGLEPSVALLRTAAECCLQSGDILSGRKLLARAVVSARAGRSETVDDYTATLNLQARDLDALGSSDEALTYLYEALDLAESERTRAIILADVACIYSRFGDIDRALTIYRELLESCVQSGDHEGRSNILGLMSRELCREGRFQEAMDLQNERLAIVEQQHNDRQRAVTIGDIGNIYLMTGNEDVALRYFREVIPLFEAWGDKKAQACTMGGVARALRQKGLNREALELHTRELAIYEELKERRSRAVTLGDIARIHSDLRQFDKAYEFQIERLRENRVMKEKEGIAVTLLDLGEIEIARTNGREAFTYFAECYTLFEELRHPVGANKSCFYVGTFLCQAGDLEQGRTMLLKARDGFAHFGNDSMLKLTEQYIEMFR